jgi:hypothetical protein
MRLRKGAIYLEIYPELDVLREAREQISGGSA